MAKRAKPPQTDAQRARRILFDTYWSSSGWAGKPQTLSDQAFARTQGYMFAPRHLTRKIAVTELVHACKAIAAIEIADAFAGSLGTRSLAQRSALGSFAFARHMPLHDCAKRDNGKGACSVCGDTEYHPSLPEDLSCLNFERHKWGGVRHDNLAYAAFDLQLFAKMDVQPTTDDDRAILAAILNAADSLPAKARARHLEKAIAPLLPSSKSEREVLISILSIAGVLEPAKHGSYRTAFLDPFAVSELQDLDSDWHYPAVAWRGSDGVNREAVAEWFPWAKLRKGKWTL